jgi:hypothetical protein
MMTWVASAPGHRRDREDQPLQACSLRGTSPNPASRRIAPASTFLAHESRITSHESLPLIGTQVESPTRRGPVFGLRWSPPDSGNRRSAFRATPAVAGEPRDHSLLIGTLLRRSRITYRSSYCQPDGILGGRTYQAVCVRTFLSGRSDTTSWARSAFLLLALRPRQRPNVPVVFLSARRRGPTGNLVLHSPLATRH